ACVVVCPEHAILFGDMDDPTTEISKTLNAHHTTVRKPEQGTAPKLFYIDGDDVALHPTVVSGQQATFATTDVITEQGGSPRKHLPILGKSDQGVPPRGPIHIGGATMAEQMVQVAYNAQHKIPWHWPVPAYLVTKGIAAGIMLILALGHVLGLFAFDGLAMLVGGLVAMIALAVTTALLVYDLERPKMFLTILLRPQWRSWLTRGAFLLVAFSTVGGAWWAYESAAHLGLLPAIDPMVRTALAWVTVPLAIGAAIYTAFLFAQAEGRDLWQSPLLPVHLIVQALYMGAGSLVLVSSFTALSAPLVSAATTTFVAGLIVDLFITLVGEFGVPHASEVAARAAHEITHGRYQNMFWWGVIGLGHVVPLALVWVGGSAALTIGVLAAVVGLYLYEHAFVMAPQEVPNS
ncbi:MAG: polysulfide reductase NrfD, partial [Myxococcales bacterium]|nr:polysulfide reductase NrfD [Myxococcales bacterium]